MGLEWDSNETRMELEWDWNGTRKGHERNSNGSGVRFHCDSNVTVFFRFYGHKFSKIQIFENSRHIFEKILPLSMPSQIMVGE